MQPIVVIVAMEAELGHFLTGLMVRRDESDGVWQDRWVEIGGAPVIVVRSGMGMAVAAAATERAIHVHAPRAVINFGCAGAHLRDLMPGDVVIGEWCVNPTRVQILPSGDERYVGMSYEVSGESFSAAELPADPTLLAFAREIAATYQPEDWPIALGWPEQVSYRSPEVLQGTLVASDVWTQAHARLDVLHGRHGSLCEDMESAAIAQICALHRVPFLAIKDISNNEYHRASDLEAFADFPIGEVGRRAAGLTRAVIERYLGLYAATEE